MADSKKLKSKIHSTINIKKITNALEIFSTIKLQKTKKSALHLREAMLSLVSLLINLNHNQKLFRTASIKSEKTLLIIIGSDKGLCGALNTTLFKKIDQLFADQKTNLDLFVVGKKAKEFFTRREYSIVGHQPLWDDLDIHQTKDLLNYIDAQTQQHHYQSISIAYNIFKNTMKYIPVIFPFWPLNPDNLKLFLDELVQEEIGVFGYNDITNVDTTSFSIDENIKIEPSSKEVKLMLHKMIVEYLIYGAILQNKASEFAARMIAMKGAKDNADEQIDNLTLSYNKARQDAITKEIIEIAGAKAIIAD